MSSFMGILVDYQSIIFISLKSYLYYAFIFIFTFQVGVISHTLLRLIIV